MRFKNKNKLLRVNSDSMLELQQQEQLSHLSLIDEQLKPSNLSPDLVLFADEVMDTLGQLLLVREKISSIQSEFYGGLETQTHIATMKNNQT